MKKRELTPEQIAARDAKRERFKVLVKQVAGMTDAQRAELLNQAGAVVTCEGRALSLHNTLLAILQTGGKASIVGGFRQWLKAGRCVKKGEHGFSIWIPLGAKGAEESAGEGEESGNSQQFGTATVFDVSQTAELEAETPVAVVGAEIAAAFGMENLPNVRIAEEVA